MHYYDIIIQYILYISTLIGTISHDDLYTVYLYDFNSDYAFVFGRNNIYLLYTYIYRLYMNPKVIHVRVLYRYHKN